MSFITSLISVFSIIISKLRISCLKLVHQIKRLMSRPQKRLTTYNTPTTGRNLYKNGLDNLGNTCFMNSSLQALYAIEGFREYSLNTKSSKPIHQSISKLFQTMNTNRGQNSVDPTDFRNTFAEYKSEFGDYCQHDSQEFIRFLIDGIHEEYNASKDWEDLGEDVLKRIFVGKFKSIIKCSKCENESNSLEEFWDISVALPQNKDECHLIQCLNNYTKSEILDTDSKCDKCKQLTKFSKRIDFQVMPLVLMIHLNKFGNNGQKCCKQMKIPEKLLIKSIEFCLISLISHRGRSSSSGHYINHSKHSDLWYLFDDEKVCEIQELDSNVMSGAYILFYQKSFAN